MINLQPTDRSLDADVSFNSLLIIVLVLIVVIVKTGCDVFICLCVCLCNAGCTSYIDLIFVVDVSGSVQFERMKLVREFLVSIVADLDIGPMATRVGAAYFSNDSYTAFTLDQYTTRQDVQEAIRYIPYIGARTNIAAGLRIARTTLLQASSAPSRDVSFSCYLHLATSQM